MERYQKKLKRSVMDIFYLFRESSGSFCAGVRVPFYYYNPDFFKRFIALGGYFDKENKMFVFRNGLNIASFNKVFFGIPFVTIEENQDRVCISGFFARSWDNFSSEDNIPKPQSQTCLPLSENSCKIQAFSFPRQFSLPEKLSEHWLKKLDVELRSRKYSSSTQKAYIYYNRLICRTLQKTPEEIRSCDVTEFIALMEKDKNYTASAMNLALSAIKFFFRNVLKKDDINDHHRPHKDGRLPMILSKEEITKILGMEKNPKHRLLLMLVYSSGLRVSEVVALKREHVDLSRKVIYVKQGKGRKDRSTLLSERAIQFIEEYYKFFSIEKWLFPGQPPTRSLSIRSAQHIFDKALSRAGIIKKITIHGLRHAFATHLLESGTDIRYIQTLLGHANIRTTERYTHVARRNVLSIKSPLDTI
jgi:site-specific recombinase XerD